MRMRQRGFGLAIAGLGLGVIGIGAAGAYVAHKLSDNVDSLTTMLNERTGEAIRAVPGERLLQMYDGLFGPDDKKRQQVKDVLTRMLNVDPTKPYLAVASMGFDVSKQPLRAELFAAPSNSPSEVINYFRPNNTENLRPIKGEVRRGQTREDFQEQVYEAFTTAISPEFGASDVEKALGRKLSPRETVLLVYDETPQGKARRSEWERLVHKARWNDAVSLLMDNVEKPIPGDMLSIPWKPLNGHQFLFVAIREEDLKAHLNDPCTNKAQHKYEDLKGCIRVWLREDAPGKSDPIAGSIPIDISLEEFVDPRNQPVANPVESQGRILWVARNLNTGAALDATTLSAMKARSELPHQLDAEEGAHKTLQ